MRSSGSGVVGAAVAVVAVRLDRGRLGLVVGSTVSVTLALLRRDGRGSVYGGAWQRGCRPVTLVGEVGPPLRGASDEPRRRSSSLPDEIDRGMGLRSPH